MNQEFINQVKEASDIVKIIGERVSLHRRGVNFLGVCPFHADKTPSLTVSPTKQMYKCFACGNGGDVIKFLQEIDKISFYEAVAILARRAGIAMPVEREMTAEEKAKADEREKEIKRCKADQNDFVANRNNKIYLGYLSDRGISTETANEFGLGYCTKGFFAERITYPFFSASGNVVGHTGRAIVWNKESNFPKYKNSAESALFHKESTLFGLQQARQEIIRNDRVFIVEGQNDVLQMYQQGFKHTVCGSGTAFSEKQARLLHRFTTNATIMYDGDNAGQNATEKTLKILLNENFSVRVVRLPEKDDPDTFAKGVESAEALYNKIHKVDFRWFDYICQKHQPTNDPETNTENAKKVCEFVALVSDDAKRLQYASAVCQQYKLTNTIVKQMVKPAPATETWKNGFYGLDEAKALLEEDERKGILTFSEQNFIEQVDNVPIIFWKGKPNKTAVQLLRQTFSEFVIDDSEIQFTANETPQLSTLVMLHKEGVKVVVEHTEDNVTSIRAFTDFYVSGYSEFWAEINANSTEKTEYINRCIQVIAFSEHSLQIVNGSTYASKLGLKQGAYNELLKPILIARKDQNELEKQRGDLESNLYQFDPVELPKYVQEDETMSKVYRDYNFYPLLKNDEHKTPCAYMFKNEKGNGHTRISDFVMLPLLHIYSNDDINNKRVIQLNHLHFGTKFLEWNSTTFSNLNKVNEKLINAGAYNFSGSVQQYKQIWQQMSYQFIKCTELKTFGQQPEGFWAFANAIYHQVETINEFGEKVKVNRVDYTNDLGVTTHKDINYYSPAFSKIFLGERENDQYEQDRFFVYKDVPEHQRIDFKQWAELMHEVYKINNNGKFAILFDILTCFRDFVYDQKKFFTTLFFIGPTGSGKSQIAYSMRSLFMSPDAPVFNLNSGSDAAFFMILERNRNVLAIMEEYNDTNISQAKFQGLKSAILDGEGKIKVKDIATKTLDSSKINAVPLPLGQEAPQQDDGSLANRSILCDVPYKPKGEFSEQEIAIFDKLKEHEKIGLSNVLIEILDCRKQFTDNFIRIFNEELKNVKETVNVNVTNTEGLTRVTNSVTMLVATCRLIEQHTKLKLPFTYNEFFQIACDKIIKQMAQISVTNKLSNYFATIGFLITQKSILIDRELKVTTPKFNYVTIQKNGRETTNVKIPDNSKLLYIHFESIYPLYERSAGKSALTQQSLRNYFESHAAYIGLVKSTKFTWYEKIDIPKYTTDAEGNRKETWETKMEKRVNNTSAYVFNYTILQDLTNVDFERTQDEPTDQPTNEINVEPENAPF